MTESDVPRGPSQGSTSVSFSVVDIQPITSSTLLALASVELTIAGVVLVLHGIRAVRTEPAGTRLELPRYRDASGLWQSTLTLPEAMRRPMGDAILDALVARGIAVRRIARAQLG